MTEPGTARPSATVRRVLGLLGEAGARPVAPPVLQPAAPFHDLSGAELARRIYFTTDPQGRELCLRPEFTIPLSRHYLAHEAAGAKAAYSYHGTVFRDRGGVGEFPQAGIELFGEDDAEDADARLLALACECAGEGAVLKLGDVGLFRAFLRAVGLSPALEAHLARRYSRAADMGAELDALLARTDARSDTSGNALTALLASTDAETARAAVDELLRVAGADEAVAGRDARDIAARYVERAATTRLSASDREKAGLLRRFLAIEASPWEALDALEALARDGGLALNGTLDDLARRLGLMADEGVDLYDDAIFSTAFGRRIDYYSGLVFELTHPGEAEPVVAGGRYDGLLRALGAPQDIPAVGFSIWIERLQPAAPALAAGTAGGAS